MWNEFEEMLCENGHYSTFDFLDMACYENDTMFYKTPTECPFCKGKMKYTHTVFDNDIAHKDEIGFDDEWKEDHHGNKYAIKVLKYKVPEFGSYWRESQAGIGNLNACD